MQVYPVRDHAGEVGDGKPYNGKVYLQAISAISVDTMTPTCSASADFHSSICYIIHFTERWGPSTLAALDSLGARWLDGSA